MCRFDWRAIVWTTVCESSAEYTIAMAGPRLERYPTEVQLVLKRLLLQIPVVAFVILAAACGGSSSSSGSDNGIAIQIVGTAVARANLTAVVPGLPRQGTLTPGSVPN